jgi:hypothetical protein
MNAIDVLFLQGRAMLSSCDVLTSKDVLTFITPNGLELYCVKLYSINENTWLCYAQNRLFTILKYDGVQHYHEIIVDYCVIPECDEILKNIH